MFAWDVQPQAHSILACGKDPHRLIFPRGFSECQPPGLSPGHSIYKEDIP